MNTNDVLADAFGRIVEDFELAVAGLTSDELAFRPDPEANSIAWLAWHAARVQDDHVSALAQRPQAWIENGFQLRFGTDFDPRDIGYGHTADQVAAAAAGQATVPLSDYGSPLTRDDLQALLVPNYLPEVPAFDAWGYEPGRPS